MRPNFTLSPGFRYENQNNIDSNFNFAPRIAFAWSPVFGHKKTATPANSQNTGNRYDCNYSCCGSCSRARSFSCRRRSRSCRSTQNCLSRRPWDLLQPRLRRRHAASDAFQWNESTAVSRHESGGVGSVSRSAADRRCLMLLLNHKYVAWSRTILKPGAPCASCSLLSVHSRRT